MTNSESFADESATDSTTNKKENATAHMSAGAEMLIERMKTNPDDFKYGGKFYRVTGALEQSGQGWVSARDQRALSAAYDEYIREPEFSEWVYGEIFNPKEPEAGTAQMYTQAMTLSSSGNLGLGTAFTDSRGIYGSALQNTTLVGASPLQGAALTVNANAGNPTMTLGNTTLSESMLSQIKTKLGI